MEQRLVLFHPVGGHKPRAGCGLKRSTNFWRFIDVVDLEFNNLDDVAEREQALRLREAGAGEGLVGVGAVCVGRVPWPAELCPGDDTSSSSADPCLTLSNRSLTLRSSLGMIPFSTAPRARGPREISTCS